MDSQGFHKFSSWKRYSIAIILIIINIWFLINCLENPLYQDANAKNILIFAQSVLHLIKLWCLPNYQDDGLYSAIVNPNGNYGIKEDIYISVPLKFENGAFCFISNYKFNSQTRSLVEEIIRVCLN